MTNETSEKVINDLGLVTQPQKKATVKYFILGVGITILILFGLSVLFILSLYLIGL